MVHGWSLFAHPLFLDPLESLTAVVEAERAKGKRDTANQKVLRGIYRYAFGEIPRDPNNTQFRLGMRWAGVPPLVSREVSAGGAFGCSTDFRHARR